MKVSRRDVLAGTGALGFAPLLAGAQPMGGAAQLLDDLFDEQLASDPTLATQWGYPRSDGVAWDRWTIKDGDWFHSETDRQTRQLRLVAKAVSLSKLDRELFMFVGNDSLERLRWHSNDYAYYASTAPHFRAFSSLIAYQPISSLADAQAYADRVEHTCALCRAEFARLEEGEARGVRLPGFNYADLASSAQDAAARAGRASVDGHPVITDFRAKAALSGIDDLHVTRGAQRIADVLERKFAPLIAHQSELYARRAKSRPEQNGVWSLPDGDAYYASQVRSHTTSDLGPEEIHKIGLVHVARLRSELAALGPALDVRSDFETLAHALRTDLRFRFPETDQGREEALALARTIAQAALARRPEYLSLSLGAELEIRAVDELSAPSSGRAFYTEPGGDGTPGIFFLNVWDLGKNPRYQLPAVVHHEAVPGHHLQAAVLHGATLPRFRKHLYLNSFAEGWALYAEKLANEFALYPDAQSQAGRIALELFRAVRLVVDTGIHAKRWSFDAALAYMNANCVNPPSDNLIEIKRYFNWPGQALGYMVGMLEIERLRGDAQRQLAARFSLPAFHDALLANGSLPIPLLRQQISDYVERTLH